MVVKGRQMIEILNKCHLACACLGNHDFGIIFLQFFKESRFNKSLLGVCYCLFLDFGVDVLISSIENSTFPWILSNVFDAETKKPLGNVQDRLIIQISDFKVSKQLLKYVCAKLY